MKTLITDSPRKAAAVLRRGGLVAFPTETVFGLGADATNARAVEAIYAAKKRPTDNPLIVHVEHVDQAYACAVDLPPAARALIDTFWPGPLTVVVERSERLATGVGGGLTTVGLRMPDHPVALELIRLSGRPIAAPSANLSGRPSPTTWQAVMSDLHGRIDCILQGHTRVGVESTVVDCRSDPPCVLRHGGVTLEELLCVSPDMGVGPAPNTGAPSPSPGTRHPHYRPSKAVVVPLLDASEAIPGRDHAYIGIGEPPEGAYHLCARPGTPEAYAAILFDFLRRCDDAGAKQIFCELPTQDGLGRAVRDRVLRAAATPAAPVGRAPRGSTE